MNKEEIYTAAQISQRFGYKQNSIKKNFKRVSESIKKKHGLSLLKTKINGQLYYLIVEEDNKAINIYNEEHSIAVCLESLCLQDMQFLVFLTVAASNNGTYRGTKQSLLNYLCIPVNKRTIQYLKEAVAALKNKEFLLNVDTEDDGYITLILKRAIERKYSISIQMLKECRRIVQENGCQLKRLPQLVKVWEAIRICEQNQPFTNEQLRQMTGLSLRQLKSIRKMLEQNNIFKSHRVGNYWKCLGSVVDLNVFYDNEQ